MKKILVRAQPTAACINKGLEEVVIGGRSRGHRIEGVGKRRTPKPLCRLSNLADRVLLDRRRRRSHPCLAWQPLAKMAAPHGAPPPLACRGRRRSPTSGLRCHHRALAPATHRRLPSGSGSHCHRTSKAGNHHRDSGSRNRHHRASGSGSHHCLAFKSGHQRRRPGFRCRAHSRETVVVARAWVGVLARASGWGVKN
jgi:hypothetical protein